MASVMTHLVRRGVEEVHDAFVTARLDMTSTNEDGRKPVVFTGFTIVLIVATVLAFAFGHFAISYTYGEVVLNLAAVEAPSSTVIVRTPPEDSKSSGADAPLLSNDEKVAQNADQEILLVRQRALTSRFCTIKRHLRAQGGKGARFRGLGVYLIVFFAYSTLAGMAGGIIQHAGLSLILAESAAYTLLTPLTLLWNHIILSKPSSKSAFQRLAPRMIVKKALLPTFLYIFLMNVTAQSLLYGCLQLRFVQNAATSPSTPSEQLGLFALVVLLGLTFFLCCKVPLKIAMVRVRASLLSSEETPIIPFDRTFNGQVVSMEDGGSGMLSLWQGFAGCDVHTFFRVIGVYAKVFVMQTLLALIGVGAVLLELRLIAGPEFVSMLVVNVAARA